MSDQRASGQIWIKQHKYFRCWRAKAGNNVWHDSESIATKVCSKIGCKWNVMFENNLVTSIGRASFNFLSEDFLAIPWYAFCKNHLQCYWPTIHNLILKICPKFQVLNSHFFNQGWRVAQWPWNCAQWKYFYFNLCRMWKDSYNLYQRFEFKNSGILCLALIFNLINPKTTVLCKKLFLVARYNRHVMVNIFW